MGTDGFEFIEYAAPDPVAMGQLFERMGFKPIAKHRHKAVTLYRQGEINFIINAEPDSFAQRFARLHGPSVCAIAFRVQDAKAAYERAISLGAWGYANAAGPGELNIPAIKGIGDSIIYFIDRWRGKNGAKDGDIGNIGFYDVDFYPLPGAELNPVGHGLTVHRPPDAQRAPGPHGRVGRLLRAHLQLPRGALLRPGRPADRHQEQGHDQPLRQDPHPDQRRRQRQGRPDPGVPGPLPRRGHPAHCAGLDQPLRHRGCAAAQRHEAAQHQRDLLRAAAQAHSQPRRGPRGAQAAQHPGRRQPGELLLQIFSENQLGPIFFEFIQRKGNQGFGEGNFKALFETMELDQVRRGVLRA
jgi:4-hydroxyphenylpyruvate dioxygenase